MFSLGRFWFVLLMFVLFSAEGSAGECVIGIQGEEMHAVMDVCSNIGTFSLGGVYDGDWEKLTYGYPLPWEGSFLTVRVGDDFYVNSVDPEEGFRMGQYVVQPPVVEGDSVSVKWMLPEGILVEECLEVSGNTSFIRVRLSNGNPSRGFNVGVRLHLDTMLGDNDGAPIYIPGVGLRVNESEYFGGDLGFRYWKAYNRRDAPSIVATGFLSLGGELTYPDRVVVSNWKRSMRSVWSYRVHEGESILGDSAVILFYNPRFLGSGETVEFVTGYGSGTSVLVKESGITEIVLSSVSGEYCPGDDVVVKVDVGSETDFWGTVDVEVRNMRGVLVYGKNKSTGLVKADSVQAMEFNYSVPLDVSLDEFIISARLYSGGELVDEKSSGFTVNASRCVTPEEVVVVGPNWFFIILFMVLVLTLVYVTYPRRGRVVIEKVKEGDLAKVVVWNRSKEDLRDCVVEDRIVEGAEVDVSTLDVDRRGTRLTWAVGVLKAGEKAVLEYRIKDVNVLPRALVRWSGGEEISK